MEVQGYTNGTRNCPRCFAVIDGNATFCPECGMSMDERASESDSAVYQELSKANLLRLRGQSKEAIETCLGILRKYPNNVTAHSLLADIHFEKEDYKQAVDWYEMALDLNPKLERERANLARAQERLKASEDKANLDQLEVKPRSFNPTLYVAITLAVVLLAATVAFFLGRGQTRQASTDDTLKTPITIQDEGGTTRPNVVPEPPTTSNQPANGLLEETTLRSTLNAQRAGKPGLDTVVLVDDHAIMTAPVDGNDTALEVQALLWAGELFATRAGTTSITVRLHTNGTLSFQGTVSLDAYNLAKEAVENGGSIDDAATAAFAAPGTNSEPPPSSDSAGATTGPNMETGQ